MLVDTLEKISGDGARARGHAGPLRGRVKAQDQENRFEISSLGTSFHYHSIMKSTIKNAVLSGLREPT